MDAKTMERLDKVYVVGQLYYGGYNTPDIATILDLNESTVRSYIMQYNELISK